MQLIVSSSHVSRENLRMRRMAQLCRNCTNLLDIGYGQAPNPYLTNPTITGVDLEAVEKPRNYSSTVRADGMEISSLFEAPRIDGIVAGEFLEHLEDPIRFLRECYQTLTPGGLLIVSTPNPNCPIERLLTLNLSRRFFYTKNHVLLFPQRWLIRILERAGFSNIRLVSGGFPLPLIGLVPFPRPWCYQTIAMGTRT